MADLKQILLTIRSGGVRYVLDILRFTLKKRRLERVFEQGSRPQASLGPGEFQQVTPLDSGCRLQFENASVEVFFLAPEVARLSWQPGSPPPPYALAGSVMPPTQISFRHQDQVTTLTSDRLQIRIFPDGSASFFTRDGSLLRRELPPERAGEAWTGRFLPFEEEIFYGMGLHSGPFNLRTRPHRLWALDAGGNYEAGHDPLYMPLPVYLSLHHQGSYLVFYENASKGEFLPDSPAQSRPEAQINFSGGMLRYYFIAGPPQTLLERFTALTGRSPLPPRWSLGYHQSRWGYRDEAEIKSVTQGFQQHAMPLSAIHLDLDHIDSGKAFSFHPGRFPDVPGLTQSLRQSGIHLVTILDPGVKQDPDFDLYSEGLNQNAFCRLEDGSLSEGVLWLGRCLYPDFTDPAVRQWWGGFYPRLLDLGVRGVWHDMNEPTSFVGWGELALPSSTQHQLDGQPGNHLRGRNLYGAQMNRAGFEGLKRAAPHQRPWILSRSGWVGSQRYAWAWSADSSTRWESMHMNLVTALSLGLSGFPYSGPDIGGFSGNPTPEMFVRWFQMAAFLPFFRTHSSIGMAPREPWVFGEPYTSILRSYLSLRYQLLPYFYTLAWEHTQTGAPLARPLFWMDGQDPGLRLVDDTFLLGQALLVAPVFNPGVSLRPVTIPAGRWYDFWNGQVIEARPGDPAHQIPAPLERLPLLVHSGSILPMVEIPDPASGFAPDPGTLALHIYPPAQAQVGRALLYSDAGDGYGPEREDTFTLAWDRDRLELDRESRGDYAFPYSAVEPVLHGARVERLWVDGIEVTRGISPRIRTGFRHIVFEVG